MLSIEIDDEVSAEMENLVRGSEQPNDVLRRVLLKGRSRSAVVDANARARTDVKRYMGRHRTRP